MRNWKHYKNKTYTQNEARKQDYELDLVHGLLMNLYDDDSWTDKVKDLLDEIQRKVHSKPNERLVK